MSGNSAFELVEEQGWQAGLSNLLRAEFRRWWKTRTWWVQSLIWIGVVDVILIMILFAGNASGEEAIPAGDMIMLYGVFGGLFASIGIVVMMQGAVVGEKGSGTAAWVLSKPVSRSAFLISKLIGNAVGIGVTALLVPGILAYLIIKFGTEINLLVTNFLVGLGLLAVFALYWLTFTLMLGTFFASRGPVIGIPLGLLLAQQFILGLLTSISPTIAGFVPFGIVMPLQEDASSSIAGSVMLGSSPESWMPVYSSIIAIIIFVTVAIRRFQREEF